MLMDLEDRRVALVMYADARGSLNGETLRVEAVITGDVGRAIRMETPDPDILKMDGCKVSMEFFNDGVYLSLTAILEVKVAGPAPFIFTLSDMSEPVEIQRRNWVRADLEVSAVMESAENYTTRTVDISAGGVRLRPILDDSGEPVVAKGDQVTVIIDLAASSPDSLARRPVSRLGPPTSSRPAPARRLARTSAFRLRPASGSAGGGAGGGGGAAAGGGGGGAGAGAGAATYRDGATAGSRSVGGDVSRPTSSGDPSYFGCDVRISARVLQSDHKVLRLMFTMVSEAAAKALTKAVFDAQMGARKGSH
ncbi:MAG: PilZ domain-containing protein [Acidimicrobiales bacterium]